MEPFLRKFFAVIFIVLGLTMGVCTIAFTGFIESARDAGIVVMLAAGTAAMLYVGWMLFKG